MLIKKISPLSGTVNEREIDITPEQLQWWNSGALIQDVMPNLSADDREFLMTGILPEEWDAMIEEDE